MAQNPGLYDHLDPEEREIMRDYIEQCRAENAAWFERNRKPADDETIARDNRYIASRYAIALRNGRV